MRYNFVVIFYWFIISFISCKQQDKAAIEPIPEQTEKIKKEEVPEQPKKETIPETKAEKKDIKTVRPIPPKWSEINTDSAGILLDIRYATKDNFTKQQIYECGKCFLRPEAAKKIMLVQKRPQRTLWFRIENF
ncbi:MAG: hypothetical protein IPM42_11785 [Saprospiraceae bacterium]|nr:hypothetical protein [Saprospiraceae bacterium]